MDKIKKTLCILLLCLITILPCSVLGNVSAETDDAKPLTVEVTTDKSSYTAYGIAEITVNVTNTSDETVNNISAEAVFNDLSPVGKNNETSKEIESLKSGESFSFSYKATVNANKVKLNFFEKIILWFVRLFNGGYSVTGNNFDDNREYISKTNVIDFGNTSANNEIKVWYEKNNLTQPDYADVEIVYNSLDYVNSDEFESLNIEEKRENVNNTLNDLAEQGYINKESIVYNESGKYFYFEYSGENYIFLEFDQEHNEGSADDIELKDFFSDIRSTIKSNSSKDIINNGSLSLNLIQTQSNGVQKNSGNAVIMYGWDSCGDVANDAELNRQYLDFYESQAEEWSERGLLTTLYTNTTVELYKFALKNNKLIVIAEHGVDYNDENEHNKVSFVLKERVSIEKEWKYLIDIGEGYICRVNGKYAINPSFFSHYYKNQLSDSIIYLGSCRGLGFGGIENHRFSYAFDTDGHAKGTLGFHNDVKINYQCDIMSCFVGNLLYGRNMKFSLDYATNECGNKGPNGEYAIITSEYSTLYEQYNVTGFVKDEITGNKISGVSVEIIDNNFYNLDPIMTKTTDENGTFYLWLPNGNYELIFTHGDYGSYSCQVTVENSDISFSEPILLTQKAYLSGTVKDNATKSPVKDASILLQLTDNNGACIAEYTCSTDENGQFTIKVPVGTYTYQINKLNFFEELYETSIGTITLFNTSENILDTIFLTPKNSSDDVNNRSIVDFGSCGANGDNVTWVLYDDGELLIMGSGDMQNYNSASNSPWYSYRENINKITLDEEITSIGKYAFSNTNIVDITIPKNIVTIYNGAFSYCDLLEKVYIEYGVKNIGYSTYNNGNGTGCFYMCTKLNEITLPNTVNMIGYATFSGCTNLKNIEIPNSVTTIGEWAFSGSGLIEITIPGSVSQVGKAAFTGCVSLEKCTIKEGVQALPNAHTNSTSLKDRTGTFENCYNLKVITLPNTLKSIGDETFANCTSLVRITIPDSVTSCGGGVFYNCTSLESVELSNSITKLDASPYYYKNQTYTQYYNGFFDKCTNLKNVNIPNSITTIGDETFANCESLESIIIPDSVITIGGGVFYNCSSLKNVQLSKNITTLNTSTHVHNSGYYGSTDALGFFQYCSSLENILIPENISEIGSYAFAYCDSLKEIVIPDNVTSIGSYIFSDSNSINNVILGKGLTTIPYGAFYNCHNLSKIIIPNNISEIITYAFYNCSNLSIIEPSENIEYVGYDTLYNTAYQNNKSNWENGILYLGNFVITSDTELSGCVEIKYGTEGIGCGAFEYCSKITNVTIPETVKYILADAFAMCDNLLSVTIPVSVSQIGTQAFFGCIKLESVIILNPECVISNNSSTICNNLRNNTYYFYGTIYGYKNSTTQAYCDKFKRNFVALDE